MKNNRRAFLKHSSILIAGMYFSPKEILAPFKKKTLTGIQLYSVRDDMKIDPLKTLQALAAFGYKHVEHANYIDRKFYGWTAKEFKKVLTDLGMTMPSGHTVLGKQHFDATTWQLNDNWKYTVEDAATAGQTYVISPWLDADLRKDYDILMRSMELFNKAGAMCKAHGMKFGYHNHDFEFSQILNGRSVYDIMLSETEPSMVMQQLDTGNLYNGGAKAIDIVKKYPGRFESLHVKDEILSNNGHEKYISTILGEGIVDLKNVVDICVQSGGTKHLIIEQEAYQNVTPMESAKKDLQVMKAWGY